jgi:hypothetical protein
MLDLALRLWNPEHDILSTVPRGMLTSAAF